MRTQPFPLSSYFGSIFLLCLMGVECACGGGGSSAPGSTGSGPSPTTPVPQFDHVILVIEENHSYSQVIGNSAMPYFNSLAKSYSLATQYYANIHPSLPNYFVLTTGSLITISDSYDEPVTEDNVVRALIKANKSWKCYAESLPSIGYLGADTGDYMQHHNPCVYFSDVQNSPEQAAKVVPFSEFATDLAGGTLPSYSLVVPNIVDDAHTCPTSGCTDSQLLSQADTWLQTNIDPLLKSPVFKNSLLIITFDESDLTDIDHGGGHVATLLVSPEVKAGYRSSTLFQHQSTLRLTMEALGTNDFPGTAEIAPDMNEFF